MKDLVQQDPTIYLNGFLNAFYQEGENGLKFRFFFKSGSFSTPALKKTQVSCFLTDSHTKSIPIS